MKGSMNTHWPFCNYRKILKMHLKVTCCCNVSDTDILYQNMSLFSFSDLHFFAGQWEVSAAVRCSSPPLSFMLALWAMHPLHGGVWHWTKPHKRGEWGAQVENKDFEVLQRWCLNQCITGCINILHRLTISLLLQAKELLPIHFCQAFSSRACT